MMSRSLRATHDQRTNAAMPDTDTDTDAAATRGAWKSSGAEVNPPRVSVVIPMLDEIGWIGNCISGFESQQYPLDRLEVIIVDSGSTDGSRPLVDSLITEHRWLRVVDNPDRLASAAFNRGVEAATGEIICLVGAHAEVGSDFISSSVSALEETGAAGVGGQLRHDGVDAVQQAIGLAMTSRFGMASPFRYSTQRCEVDTIGHPAYRREVLEAVGAFDESLLRNSDYEMNYRIRAAGHSLVLDPTIITVYRPRSTLRALARQFYNYGLGKSAVTRRHPRSLKLRHGVAPAATVLAAATPAMLSTRSGRWLVAGLSAGYGAMLGAAVLSSRPHDNGARVTTFVAAFPVMHLSWGAGFLVGMVSRHSG